MARCTSTAPPTARPPALAIDVDDKSWDELVLKSKVPVLVDFWCVPDHEFRIQRRLPWQPHHRRRAAQPHTRGSAPRRHASGTHAAGRAARACGLMADACGFHATRMRLLTAGFSHVVDCRAPWCGPCRMIEPIVNELAGDYAGKILCVSHGSMTPATSDATQGDFAASMRLASLQDCPGSFLSAVPRRTAALRTHAGGGGTGDWGSRRILHGRSCLRRSSSHPKLPGSPSAAHVTLHAHLFRSR